MLTLRWADFRIMLPMMAGKAQRPHIVDAVPMPPLCSYMGKLT